MRQEKPTQESESPGGRMGRAIHYREAAKALLVLTMVCQLSCIPRAMHIDFIKESGGYTSKYQMTLAEGQIESELTSFSSISPRCKGYLLALSIRVRHKNASQMLSIDPHAIKAILDGSVMPADDNHPDPQVDTLSPGEYVVSSSFEYSKQMGSLRGYRGIPIKIALDGLLKLGDQTVVIDTVRAIERQPCGGY